MFCFGFRWSFKIFSSLRFNITLKIFFKLYTFNYLSIFELRAYVHALSWEYCFHPRFWLSLSSIPEPHMPANLYSLAHPSCWFYHYLLRWRYQTNLPNPIYVYDKSSEPYTCFLLNGLLDLTLNFNLQLALGMNIVHNTWIEIGRNETLLKMSEASIWNFEKKGGKDGKPLHIR